MTAGLAVLAFMAGSVAALVVLPASEAVLAMWCLLALCVFSWALLLTWREP